jgi:hypothetical protein
MGSTSSDYQTLIDSVIPSRLLTREAFRRAWRRESEPSIANAKPQARGPSVGGTLIRSRYRERNLVVRTTIVVSHRQLKSIVGGAADEVETSSSDDHSRKRLGTKWSETLEGEISHEQKTCSRRGH